MSELLHFLKSMISIPGLSGHEAPVARLLAQTWSPLVDELTHSKLGSIHGLKKGSGRTSQPSVMIATHMDAIGLMVSRIVDGFLYLAGIGGVDPRVLPGTPVAVHATDTNEELYGVIVMPPAALLPEGKGNDAVGLNHLFVDTGLTSAEVAKRVKVGDLVSFATEPLDMPGAYISGHTLDNRASIAALTLCLEALQNRDHFWDVYALASVQEETNYAGAATSAYQLRPSIAIAVDVTHAKGPGTNDYSAIPLGNAITLGIGPSMHPHLYRRLKEVAEKAEIPVVDDAVPLLSYTDADALQLSAEGIPTMLVSIPLRYMHTPVEMIALKDVQRAGRLLAEFVTSLEADFIHRIVWD